MTNASLATQQSAVGAPGSHWRIGNLVGLAALTAYSTGVSWQAQLVSYPLYRATTPQDFPAYHLAYNAAIPGVVIIPGFLCFLACAAFPWTRPLGVPRLATALVAVSGIGSLLTTVLWAIPMHDRLDEIGQDAATITSLLQSNWVRTALLTLGAATLSWSVVRLLRNAQVSVGASATPRRAGSPRR